MRCSHPVLAHQRDGGIILSMKPWQLAVTILVVIILVEIGVIVFRKTPEAPTTSPTVTNERTDEIPNVHDVCTDENAPSDCAKG